MKQFTTVIMWIAQRSHSEYANIEYAMCHVTFDTLMFVAISDGKIVHDRCLNGTFHRCVVRTRIDESSRYRTTKICNSMEILIPDLI